MQYSFVDQYWHVDTYSEVVLVPIKIDIHKLHRSFHQHIMVR